MKSLVHLGVSALRFFAGVAFACASAQQGEAADGAAPVPHTTEQTALVKALDEQLTRCETLLSKDEDAVHASAVKAVLELLKQRRDVFNRVAFDQGKYDELRFDLNVVYQRLHLWLAPPIAPKAPPKTKTSDSANTRS